MRSTTRPAPALAFRGPWRPPARCSLCGCARLRRRAVRAALGSRTLSGGSIRVRLRCVAQLCELLTQLLQLGVKRIDLIARRQPERAYQCLRLLPLLREECGGGISEL